MLYNNAAGFGFAPFTQMDLKLWRHVMNVELDLVFHTTSAAWPLLIEGGGSLINIASYSALLGIQPLETGCKTVRVKPYLGGLTWAEGAFPTPAGVIKVRHSRQGDGSVKSEIQAPDGIRIVRE